MPATIAGVRSGHLAPDELDDLFLIVLRCPPGTVTTLLSEEITLILTADLLMGLKSFSWRQVLRLLVALWDQRQLLRNALTAEQTWPLVLIDRCWAYWPGSAEQVLNLATGQWTYKPVRPLESLAYDLTELYLRHQHEEAGTDAAGTQG